MKKSIILKSFLVILISMMLVFTASTVHAETASNAEYEDLFGEGSSNTNNTNNANANANRSNTNNTNRNNTNNTNRNNTNTTLPKTGIEDSLPTVVLVVVFGVSAVYAYKKIKDYRNID